MTPLKPGSIDIDPDLLRAIDADRQSIYRLLVFSDEHQSTDLLDRYKEAVHHLRDVLNIKNAQQEAHSLEEAREYLANLNDCMAMIISEVGAHRCISGPVDLFFLFKIIAPDVWAKHPNRYRQSLVQFGSFFAPEPEKIQSLVENVFAEAAQADHPVLRAVYLHHELVRIHPFADGNGRVSRMAKNWVLMYELYPPVFIYGGVERKSYLRTLQESFEGLLENPGEVNDGTRAFFHDEMLRIKASTSFLLNRMKNTPDDRFRLKRSEEKMLGRNHPGSGSNKP